MSRLLAIIARAKLDLLRLEFQQRALQKQEEWEATAG